MMPRVALALVLLMALSAPCVAQEADQADTVRLGVELVQIDVVVTDEDGGRVTGLGPADFEIYEDGRPQEITNFSYVDGSRPPAPPRDAKRDGPAPPPSSGGSAGAYRKPWMWSQRMSRRIGTCSAESTPSATTVRPRLCAIETTAAAIPAADGFVSTSRSRLRSIFSTSRLKRFR